MPAHPMQVDDGKRRWCKLMGLWRRHIVMAEVEVFVKSMLAVELLRKCCHLTNQLHLPTSKLLCLHDGTGQRNGLVQGHHASQISDDEIALELKRRANELT